MKEENVILFDEASKLKLLDIMGKIVDSQSFIVEKNAPTQRVVTIEGEEIKINEFAGVKKGSEIFIKNDINSVLELADSLDKDDTRAD